MPHQAKMSPPRYAKLIHHLLEGEYNCRELAALTDLHYITVLEYTKALHAHVPKVIYIAKWDKDSLGRESVRVYAFGDKEDAARRTLGRAEQQRRYRARKVRRAEHALENDTIATPS